MRLREIRERAAHPEPGSSLFGELARSRRERLIRRDKEGDLRVKTAYRTEKDAREAKDRLLAGD